MEPRDRQNRPTGAALTAAIGDDAQAERLAHEGLTFPVGDGADDAPGWADAEVRAIQKEVQAMQRAATEVVEGFDFERARRAIDQRATLHRRATLGMALGVGLLAVAGVVIQWGGPGAGPFGLDVRLLAWTVGVPAAPLVLWLALSLAARARERRLLRTQGELVLPELFERSRKRVIQEFELIRACAVLTAIGLVVLVGDAIVNGWTTRGGVAIGGLVFVLLLCVPRVFGRRARRRVEAFARGDMTAEAFAAGRDDDDDDDSDHHDDDDEAAGPVVTRV